MTREEFIILAVDSGSPRLADQLPVLASVSAVHQDGNDGGDIGVYFAEFDSPLRMPLPEGADPTWCAPEYLGEDENGPFIWAYFAAVRPDTRTERRVAPRRKEMTATLGIIADQAAAVDYGLDLAAVIWAATVTIGRVESPVVDSDDPTTDPLPILPPPAMPEPSTGIDARRPDINRRRTLLIVGIAVVAVLLGLAIGFWMDDGTDGTGSPEKESSTSTMTSSTATTTVSSLPPPPPPPPPTSESPSQTYVPYNPPRQSRPNITTPQTRGPDISVRPTHRPAFPNQPG